jgi:4-hydroxybenzoate polyprenyltransferase
MVDREDDVRIGIRTSALTFGRFDVAAVIVCYAALLSILGVIGWQLDRGPAFWLGLAAAAGIMGYHYVLIRERDRQKCFKAFLHNNWVGAAIFVGIAADYWLNPPPV